MSETQSEKKQDSFDANDFYFSKVVSILIAVSYIITLLVKGTPFDLSSTLSRFTIFSTSANVVPFTGMQVLFIASLVLVICLDVFSLVFLVKGKAKAGAICEAVSCWSAVILFVYYVCAVFRFSVKPTNKGFALVMYSAAGLWFLICGVANIVKFLKNKVKLKIAFYLPAIISFVLFLVLMVMMTRVVLIKQSYDAYNKDVFGCDPSASVQAGNFLRGAVSIDDVVYCVQKLSDNEYGIVKIGGDGSREVLDKAAFIADHNLVVNGDLIYYLKYPGFWEDVYIAPSMTKENSNFKLCTLNIKTGEVRELYSDSFAGSVGINLFDALLIGMRDNRIFMLSRSAINHAYYEIYCINVVDGYPDPASVYRYAWNISLTSSFYDRSGDRETLYNGLIVDYNNFYHVVYGDVCYEHEYTEQLQILERKWHNESWTWEDSYHNSVFGTVVDYNVYNGVLYYARINWDTRLLEVYRRDDPDTDVLIGTIDVDAIHGYINRTGIVISDSYLVVVCGTEYYILPS